MKTLPRAALAVQRRPRRLTMVVEFLEERALLASYTFQMPDVSAFLNPPRGVNTGPALFSTLLGSLQYQLSNGPVVDLQNQVANVPKGTAGSTQALMALVGATDTSNPFLDSADGLVSSFDAAIVTNVQPYQPVIAGLLVQQGTALDKSLELLYQRYIAGLDDFGSKNQAVDTYNYAKNVTQTVRELTESRPMWATGTPILSLYQRADEFAHDLSLDLSSNVGQNTNGLTLDVVTARDVALADAASLASDFAANSTTNRAIDQKIDTTVFTAVAAAGNTLGTITASTSTADALAIIHTAWTDFESTVMVGLFQNGLRGVFKPPINTFEVNGNPADWYRLYTFQNARVYATSFPVETWFFRYASDTSRTSGPENNYFGAYLTTQEFTSTAKAIRYLALDQSWYHPSLASIKLDVRVVPNATIYYGKVAPIYQGVLSPERCPSLYPGGVTQVVVVKSPTGQFQTDFSKANPRPTATPPSPNGHRPPHLPMPRR